MPFLGAIFSVLGGFATALFSQFVLLFGRKYTVATASVLAFIATTATLIVCLKSILAFVVSLIVLPAWIYTAIAWFIPSNAVSVISAILSGRICKQAHNMVQTKIDLITKAT